MAVIVSASPDRTRSGITANCSPGFGSRANGFLTGARRGGFVSSVLFGCCSAGVASGDDSGVASGPGCLPGSPEVIAAGDGLGFATATSFDAGNWFLEF